MNLQTVITNLNNTIAGKEQAVKEYNKACALSVDPMDMGERMAITATVEFLKINIDELRRILQDVEQCQEYDQYQEGYDKGVSDSFEGQGSL